MAGWQNVTLVVIAKDEERNIAACLESAPRCGHRLVVDSGSQDATVAIALGLGAEVIHNPWHGYSEQYNFAFNLVKTPWTLMLDADERLTPELEAEMASCLEGNEDVAAWEAPRANYFCGQWMRHGGWYPDYQTRLFQTGSAQYELRAVHSRMFVNGERRRLKGNILHFSYESVADWMARINNYTTLEVKNKDLDFDDVRNEWTGYDLKMRLKYRMRRTPGRPLLRFIWMFVLRQGFRDGRRGLALAVLSAFYEYAAQVKWEEAHRWRIATGTRAHAQPEISQ